MEAILAAGHMPAAMEQFAPGDETAWEKIKAWIDESDAFILILGGRYGCVLLKRVWAARRRGESYSSTTPQKSVHHRPNDDRDRAADERETVTA